MAFSGFIKVRERPRKKGVKGTQRRGENQERTNEKARKPKRKEKPKRTEERKKKEKTERDQRTEKKKEKEKENKEKKNTHTEHRRSRKGRKQEKKVRHKKRRLGNIGEGKPRVERRVPIFLQNSSNKAPALGKLLSIPSPLIYLPSYYACTRELIHACLPTMVSRVIGLGKCSGWVQPSPKKKQASTSLGLRPSRPNLYIGARMCLAEHTLIPYPFYFTLFCFDI